MLSLLGLEQVTVSEPKPGQQERRTTNDKKSNGRTANNDNSARGRREHEEEAANENSYEENNMLVREIIRSQGPLIVCRPEDTVQTAAVILHSKYIGAMPVMDDKNRLVGMFGERDIVRAFANRLPKIDSMLVSDLMAKNVIVCKPENSVLEAMALMKRHKIRHLPVCEDGKVVGIVSIRDTLDVLRQNAEENAAVMRDISIARR